MEILGTREDRECSRPSEYYPPTGANHHLLSTPTPLVHKPGAVLPQPLSSTHLAVTPSPSNSATPRYVTRSMVRKVANKSTIKDRDDERCSSIIGGCNSSLFSSNNTTTATTNDSSVCDSVSDSDNECSDWEVKDPSPAPHKRGHRSA